MVSSHAILKYGIRIAFTHDTKPKIKKSSPMIRIEIKEALLVRELTSMAGDIVLAIVFIYVIILAERRRAEALSRKQIQLGCNCRILAG